MCLDTLGYVNYRRDLLPISEDFFSGVWLSDRCNARGRWRNTSSRLTPTIITHVVLSRIKPKRHRQGLHEGSHRGPTPRSLPQIRLPGSASSIRRMILKEAGNPPMARLRLQGEHTRSLWRSSQMSPQGNVRKWCVGRAICRSQSTFVQ